MHANSTHIEYFDPTSYLRGQKYRVQFRLPTSNRRSRGCTVWAQGKERTEMGREAEADRHQKEKNQNETWLVIYRRQAERSHDWCYCEDLSCSSCRFSCPQHPLCGSTIQKQPMFIGVWCRQNQKQGHGCFPASRHSAAPRLSSANPVAFKSHFQKVKSHEHREEVQQ